jgi:hypothetical protein
MRKNKREARELRAMRILRMGVRNWDDVVGNSVEQAWLRD